MRLLILLAALMLSLIPALAFATPAVGTVVAVTASATSNVTFNVTGVSAGSALCFPVFNVNAGIRTYTITDDEGTGNTYGLVASNDTAGAQPFIFVYCGYNISPGDGTLSITIDQSSTATGYSYAAIEFETSTTLSADTFDIFDNTTVFTHLAAASGNIDTAAGKATAILSACTFNSNPSTKTDSDGAGTTWQQIDSSAVTTSFAQYRVSASALTDEQASMTTSTQRISVCLVISLQETAAGSRIPNGLSLVGVA